VSEDWPGGWLPWWSTVTVSGGYVRSGLIYCSILAAGSSTVGEEKGLGPGSAAPREKEGLCFWEQDAP
jgi:hypothetical protein